MKLYKKIDLYTRRKFIPKGFLYAWEYAATTEQSKTCKEAKRKFCQRFSLDNSQVKACFQVK